MCGVHAVVRMPSATAMRAISREVASSGEPSSMPGSRWQWRSIIAVAADSARRAGCDWPARSPTPGCSITPARASRTTSRWPACAARNRTGCAASSAPCRAPAPSCSSVKLRPALVAQQRRRTAPPRREQQRDDDRRREPQLHERLQIIVVRVVDEPADVRDLEARKDVGDTWTARCRRAGTRWPRAASPHRWPTGNRALACSCPGSSPRRSGPTPIASAMPIDTIDEAAHDVARDSDARRVRLRRRARARARTPSTRARPGPTRSRRGSA